MADHPKKLKQDSITEALLEVRFSSSMVPEVLIGILANAPMARGFVAKRLPIADIPMPIRSVDKDLQFQPSLQLDAPDGLHAVKLGERVFSWHALRVYPGWEKFRPELGSVLQFLFEAVPSIRTDRLGFRYINLLRDDVHGIEDVCSLNVTLDVANKPLRPPLNLNYLHSHGDSHRCMVRMASPEFVQGAPPGATAIVDIDVFSSPNFSQDAVGPTIDWVDEAHNLLKDQFFPLMPGSIIARLVEE